jgi:UDP-GlcNAc:undecaprenyl-phosphate GlcNAc-1-phosphate transferase
MTARWVWALLIADLVALVATPVARRVALNIGLVDLPGPGKSHSQPTAYLGGIALAAAVLAAILEDPYRRVSAVIAVCIVVLVVTGLFDDARPLPPALRLSVEVGCAVAAIAAGVELNAGMGYIDLAVTLLLLIGIANAVNLLDNLDGLAAGVTAAGAAGVLAVTVMDHHDHIAVSAAALVGACLGFLIFNARRATIFMGDAGSLFLGFLLAVIVVEAAVLLPHPARVLFPVLILALPVADTTTVVVARLRNGRSVVLGGKDHLSHRLARAGLGSGKAVALLIAIEAFMAGLAIAVAREVMAAWAVSALGGGVLLALVTAAGRIRVYGEPAASPTEREGVAPSGRSFVSLPHKASSMESST